MNRDLGTTEVDTTEVDTAKVDNMDDNDFNEADVDFDLSGLSADEIAAIESYDNDDHNEGEADEHTETEIQVDAPAADEPHDSADDSAQPDAQKAGAETADDKSVIDVTDNQGADEAAQLAVDRTGLDERYDAALEKMRALGEDLDNGEIHEGAYNAERLRIEREIKRLDAIDAKLSEREAAVANEVESEQQQHVAKFDAAVTDFMQRPENNVFVKGSAEFSALDKQLGIIAESMPPGTDFMVMLEKARQAVGQFMTLPSAENKSAEKTTQKKAEDDIMPSINGMPSVVPNTNEGNKFAHIDKLSGPEQEKAIANMSQDMQDEYLRS